MRIPAIVQLHGPQSVNGPHRANEYQQTAKPSGLNPVDQVDISPEAQAASQSRESGEIRFDRVAEIRSQIKNGTYETPEKLDAALDRLLEAL